MLRHVTSDIADAYESSGDAGQELVLNLALFLSNFLSNHLRAVETPASKDVLLNAHLYIVKISQVEEREVFKICLEYWLKLVAPLYEELQALPMGDSGLLMGLNLGGASGLFPGINLRKNIYKDVLSNLRLVVVERMVKPEEVCVSSLRKYIFLICLPFRRCWWWKTMREKSCGSS
jgi:exportin-1